ncbi:plasmid recombination protein [Pseudogemmobacter sonorensis]|uniref:plasmid recombination protein n=1 Tax=Pseudogemmobacter sonorensis TaxID=2989681 RepID=UPI0036BC0044
MSVHTQFDNAQPVTGLEYLIVLRFTGLHPNDLGRFGMHDKRQGGDLSHVDSALSDLNEELLAGPRWKDVIQAEVREASQSNLTEHLRALTAKSRKKEARAVETAGLVDPWQRSKGGPLREGILTVSKEWFGGTGHNGWDPKKVARFRKAAMAFLKRHFPDGQLRYASAHADEEAYHIHFVVAVWRERTTANRGRQIRLQASMNPWSAPTDCSGLNVSALSVSGPFARRPLGLVACNSERCAA